MSCGKRPLVKNWDKPKKLRVITPSRYEQNEASVKLHWKKVIRDLEDSYKDDQFWETNANTVRHLVGPVLFQRLAKIFDLQLEENKYKPKPEIQSPVPSEEFYKDKTSGQVEDKCSTCSISSSGSLVNPEGAIQEDEYDKWSVTSIAESSNVMYRSKTMNKSKSFTFSGSLSRITKSVSKNAPSKTRQKYSSRQAGLRSKSTANESVASSDDVYVHVDSKITEPRQFNKNPHYDMLYCNESETDMIKWKSKYKQKIFEVSASDEFSKKAEIMTKKISKEFYDWWVGLGNVEFKSEIRRPEDIEDLFQVWFDEHASRSLKLEPKILPCVLQSIADYVGVPKASCPNFLKRQIAYDIHAETSPAHVKAFGSCLSQTMKHIPPKNNTKAMWHSLKIPEDLKSMACVWGEIQHLTSTKAFHNWLQQYPHLPMPPCLKELGAAGDKKQLFVVPSDYVVTDKSSTLSSQELALPVSQWSLELKEVLSRLMNQ